MTASPVDAPVRRHHWSDWVGVGCYTALAVNIALGSRELGVLILPSLIHELLVAAAFILRGPARRVATGIVPRVVGYFHTFLIIGFLQVAALWHPEWVRASDNETAKLAGSYLWLMSSILGLWPLWYLRRSFSLEPEARQLVVAGPYRLARHPIYAVYILNNTGIWLRTLSIPFLFVLLLWFALLALRVRYEESVLAAAFPEYEQYRRRVGPFGPHVSSFVVRGIAGIRHAPDALRELFREHSVAVSIVALYLLTGYALQAFLIPGMMQGMWYWPTYVLFAGGGVVGLAFTVAVRRWRTRDASGARVSAAEGWRRAWRSARQDLLSPTRLLRLGFVTLLVPLFLEVFGRYKFIIPYVHPFAWDVRLNAIDRALHFGHQPWELLQPVLGHPAVTRMIDFTYVLVLLCCFVAIVAWQGLTGDRRLRQRFVLTFVLTWIVLGTVMATVFSSAGPCFYPRVTGLPDPYAGLMRYLETLHHLRPLVARQAQEALWSSYNHENNVPFMGISAMPSIHVAMPTFFALLGWQVDRRLGQALTAFAVLMFLGSIHLGWHYAVDGYVSALGVLAIWKLSDRWVAR